MVIGYNFIYNKMSKRDSSTKELKRDNTKKDSSKSLKTNNGQNDLVRMERQKQIMDNLNRENMLKYLQALHPTEQLTTIVDQANEKAVKNVTERLKNGQLTISQKPCPIPEKGVIVRKLNSEELKQSQIKIKREQVHKKIQYLQQQIWSSNNRNTEKESPLRAEIKDVLSKEQHQRKVRSIISEKEELRKRHEEIQEQERRKIKQEDEQKQILKKIEEEKQQQDKRRLIQLKIKQRKEQHQKVLSQESALQKQLEKVKQKDRLYQKMENRYQSQILLPSLEEKKNKLKQLREFHKMYDLSAVKQHQKTYLLKKSGKADVQKSPEKWEYQPPARSERLAKLLKEEEIQIKQKYDEKRKNNEERARRQQNFLNQLKDKHQPKIDQQKRKELERRLIEEHKKRERVTVDSRKLGEAYMETAKRMRRSESLRQSQVKAKTTEQDKSSKHSEEVATQQYHSQQFYEHIRRKKLQQIVNSQQGSTNQKYNLLRIQAERLGERFRQKEQLARIKGEQAQSDAAELLLSSIKAKMGIITLLAKQKQSPNKYKNM